MKETRQYIDLVYELNEELFEKYADQVSGFFEYNTDGYSHLIKFGGFVLWNSEDDDRSYVEKTDEYEPLEPFIRKEFNRMIDQLKKLKL